MNQSNQLNELMKGKTFKILEIFLNFPSKEFSTKEIMKRTKFSKATLAKWLAYLKENDFLELKKIGATKLYKLDRENVIVKYFKILQNIIKLQILKNISQKYGCDVFLFGSMSRGEDNEKSDIDLLIIVDKHKQSIVNEIQNYEIKLGRKLRLQVFDEIEWAAMERKDKAFYERVEKDKIKIS